MSGIYDLFALFTRRLTNNQGLLIFMLTCTTKIYKKNYEFRTFGTESRKTQVFRFLDKVLEDKKIQGKLTSILDAINNDPRFYSHDQKFKHLEGSVWEIKIKSIRIACIWDPNPKYLIAIYGCKKKRPDWSKQDLVNMRNQHANYLSLRKQPKVEDRDVNANKLRRRRRTSF